MRSGRRIRRGRFGFAGMKVAFVGVVGAAALGVLLPGGAGAQATVPTVTAEPTTDLVDGDEVTVTVTDASSNAEVQVLQCTSGASLDDCDDEISAYAMTSTAGTGTVTLRVAAMLHPGRHGSEVREATDCRENDGCVLQVNLFSSGGGGISEPEIVPLDFDPEGSLIPPPALSVAPDTAVTHAETVAVTGSGFTWSPYEVFVRQCVADPVDFRDCDHTSEAWIDPSESGDFETETRVYALIETANRGVVDCRMPGSCVIAAFSSSPFVAQRSATAPITFDPDTEVVPPTLDVTPSTGLADGDTVTVTGAGFASSYLTLSLCGPGASLRWTDCRSVGWVESLDGGGGFTIDVTVFVNFTTETGDPVDCHSGSEPCSIVAGTAESFESLRLGRAELGFNPDAPLLSNPTIEVDPSDDLADYIEVTVTGSGFLPKRGGEEVNEAWLRVCRTGDAGQCDYRSEQWVEPDASGGLTAQVAVSSAFTGWDDGSGEETTVDCKEAPGCEIRAVERLSGRSATHALHFAPPEPPEDRYLDPVFEDVDVSREVTFHETVDTNGDPVQLQFDIYEPAGDDAEQRPAIVWMPGDGSWWVDDSREDVAEYAEAFAQRGYVAITMDYRMRPGLNCCPARDALGVTEAILDGHEDAMAGISWLQDHAADHRIDPEAIAVAGASAGATNTFGLAYLPEEVDHARPDIAAAVAISGNSYGRPAAGAVPVLAFHGENDDLAPVSLSERTCSEARKVDARCEVVAYPGAWHDITTSRQRDIVQRSSNFLVEAVLAPLGYVEEPPPPDESPAGTTTTTTGPGLSTRTTDSPGAQIAAPGEKSGGSLPHTGSELTSLLLRLGLALVTAGLALLALAYLRRRRGRVAAGVGSVAGLSLALVAVAATLSSPGPAAAQAYGELPDDWTEEQVAYAEALIDDTEAGLERFHNQAILPLLGFSYIGDGAEIGGGYQHWTNIAWIDGDNLNPEHPESLVFSETGSWPALEAAMYMVPHYNQEEIPEEIAWLPGWHVHDNLCFEGSRIVGLADEDGNCERGSVIATPYMMHVWIVDTPCGRFAGIDEHGLMCDQHEH